VATFHTAFSRFPTFPLSQQKYVEPGISHKIGQTVSPMKWSSVDVSRISWGRFSSSWPRRWLFGCLGDVQFIPSIPFPLARHSHMQTVSALDCFAYIPATAPTDGRWLMVRQLVTMAIRFLKAPWLNSGQIEHLTCPNAVQRSPFQQHKPSALAFIAATRRKNIIYLTGQRISWMNTHHFDNFIHLKIPKKCFYIQLFIFWKVNMLQIYLDSDMLVINSIPRMTVNQNILIYTV